VLGALALLAGACARPVPSPRPTPTPLSPEFDRWNEEARNILSDVVETLRTFDTFQAFRVSTARESSTRLPSELAWDPPTSTAWDEATHVTLGVHGRAEQLFQKITTAKVDPNLWREQRALADATYQLIEASNVLDAYRRRVDVLPPGDASAATGLLERAWSQWESAAARWAIGRAELIGCAGAS
jgi:hypothetical protein